jgi:GntR family transcriptional regulator
LLYQYSMLLHVNPSSGVPSYLQIETQVKHYIAAGALALGDALPSVRKLAADLRISTNTVARAYQNLERDGVLRTVPGGRTYVAENSPGLLKSEKIRRLRPYARQIAVEGTQLRLDPLEIIELVQQELEALEEVNERSGDLDRRTR